MLLPRYRKFTAGYFNLGHPVDRFLSSLFGITSFDKMTNKFSGITMETNRGIITVSLQRLDF